MIYTQTELNSVEAFLNNAFGDEFTYKVEELNSTNDTLVIKVDNIITLVKMEDDWYIYNNTGLLGRESSIYKAMEIIVVELKAYQLEIKKNRNSQEFNDFAWE